MKEVDDLNPWNPANDPEYRDTCGYCERETDGAYCSSECFKAAQND